MLIREMTFADIPQVVEIEMQCFSLPWSEKSFQDSLVREDTLFLVCEDQKDTDITTEYKSEITGYIGMYISFDEANITNVAVSSKQRKKGYGEALVSIAKKRAKNRQAEKMFLEVRVSNTPAISLYQKMGFQNLGVRKNFYDHPQEDAYIMACDLLL